MTSVWDGCIAICFFIFGEQKIWFYFMLSKWFQSPTRSGRLFIAENNLDHYRHHPTILEALTIDVNLLNYHEFIQKFGVDGLKQFKQICDFNEDFFDDLITNLQQTDTFDLLTAVDTKDTIMGFIICQLGEYRGNDNAYSVKLICTQRTFKAMILLQAYLFCIINSSFEKIGILQLSGAYTNIPGFITYTRCGFRKDLRFVTRNIDLLPMSVNLTSVLEFSIVIEIFKRLLADDADKTVDISRLRVDDDESGIYNFILYRRGVQPDEQSDTVLHKLIVYNNLLLMIQMVEKLYVLHIGGVEIPFGFIAPPDIFSDLRSFFSKSSHEEEVRLFESIFSQGGQRKTIDDIKMSLSIEIQRIKDYALGQYFSHSSGSTSFRVGGKIKKRKSKVKKTKRKTKQKTRNRFSK